MRKRVAIIGGGIIGCSIAYHLAKLGVNDVVVIERNRLGSGSTSACLGGFRYQFSEEASVKMSLESIPIIINAKEEIGVDPYVQLNGYLFLAYSDKNVETLEKIKNNLERHGISVETPSSDELSHAYPFYSFEGLKFATLCRAEGRADTMSILAGYVKQAKAKGVTFVEGIAVNSFEKYGDRFVLYTGGSRIETDKIVIAAGAYSGLVGSTLNIDIPIFPVPRRILFASIKIDVPSMPLIVDVDTTFALGKEGAMIYFSANEAVGRSFELNFPEDYEERIISKLVSRAPKLREAMVVSRISGLYEMTPDSLPIISEVTKNVYCCAGFCGHGFMHSPFAGKVVSELVAGLKPSADISPFSIDRFSGLTQVERAII